MDSKTDNEKKGINEIIIRSLNPKILTDDKDLKKIQPYLDLLRLGIDNKDVTNLALTGNYGSGKSTVLRTFKHQNKESYNFLDISLAAFREELGHAKQEIKKADVLSDENVAGDSNTKHNLLNRQIEVSILQQIIYQVKPEEIPDSRFQRIVSLSEKKQKRVVYWSLAWLISLVILFVYGGLERANPNNWTFRLKDLDLFSFFTLFSIPVFLLGIGFLVHKVGRVLSNSKIDKFTVKGEIELGKDVEKSIFNKHFDEILYFFEQTKVQVVIIEDLDRFKNTDIFTKLREINLLLNKSKSIEKAITFVYAVRDEIFTTNERVKFFDFIIPVIPFIDASNAKNKFHDFLLEEGLQSDIQEGFIDDVVAFIDDVDMRLLTNVFQEFKVYYEQLGLGLKLENLFALILYKNLYPRDFADLYRRKGKLYTFFKNKYIYLNRLTIELKAEMEGLEKRIDSVEKLVARNIDELKAIYIHAIMKRRNITAVKIDEVWVDLSRLSSDDYFEKLVENDEFYYKNYGYGYTHINQHSSEVLSFKDIESEIDAENSFNDRVFFVKSKFDNHLEDLKEQLLAKQKLNSEMASWDIKKIFSTVSINNYLANYKRSDLVRSLLSNGYIDENYIDYMSIFHESKMKLSDNEFVKSVRSSSKKEPSYKISSPREVIKDLNVSYFSRKEILNYDVLRFLLQLSPANKSFIDKADALLKQIYSIKTGTQGEYDMFQFIDGYIEHFSSQDEKEESIDVTIPKLIEKLSINTGILWNSLFNNNATAQTKIDKYLKLIIGCTEANDLAKNEDNNRLKRYIQSHSEIIDVFEDYTKGEGQSLATLLTRFNTKFNKLLPKKKTEHSLYDFVYENNHYTITEHNIKEILKAYYDYYSEDKFKESNYTEILQSGCSFLIEYIQNDNNINTYIENVLLNINTNINESEETIVDILNHSKIHDKLKVDLIKMQKNKINNLSRVEYEKSIRDLIVNDKIVPNWSNLLTCFLDSKSKIDSYMIDFLNEEDNYKRLAKIDFIVDYESDLTFKKFITSIVGSNDLTQLAYESLLSTVSKDYFQLHPSDFKQLNDNKISFLINNEILLFTKENFDFVCEKSTNLFVELIVLHQEDLIEKLNDWELVLDDNELKLLVDAEGIDIVIKEKYIKQNHRELILKDKKIATLIGRVASDLSRADLLSSELKAIFNIGNVDERTKVKILNNHFENLDNTEIKSLLSLISPEYDKIFMNDKKAKFGINVDVLELVDNILGRGLIKSFYIRDIKEGQYIYIIPLD